MEYEKAGIGYLVHCLFCRFFQNSYRMDKVFESWVLGLTMVKAIIDLLGNDGQAEQAKAMVERHVFNGAS